ncbi:unnamed protein product [Boreogadus saida]
MLELCVVEESHSDWCSPVVLVGKPDGYNPPHRTDQTHLQPLSNHVDCYKAAGMKADVASGPDRRTEWGRCRSRVGAMWALRRGIAPSVEG